LLKDGGDAKRAGVGGREAQEEEDEGGEKAPGEREPLTFPAPQLCCEVGSWKSPLPPSCSSRILFCSAWRLRLKKMAGGAASEGARLKNGPVFLLGTTPAIHLYASDSSLLGLLLYASDSSLFKLGF